MPEAARTLVKSPPELWAEVSDPTALARHLGAFGDIRITRLEPEATVAWEGDRASGTVALQPTGWGTKVTVAAEPVAADQAPEVEGPPAVEEPPAPASQAPAEASPAAGPERRGLLARLFRRRPKAPSEDPAEVRAIEDPTPEAAQAPPVAEAAPEAHAPEVDADAVLARMLSSLGAAHHRPFSRG